MALYHILASSATSIEIGVCLACAYFLSRIQRETYDRSRRFLVMGSAISGLMALAMILVNTTHQNAPALLLRPWIGLAYMTLNIVMVLYPISILRPEGLKPRHFTILFLPALILGLAFLGFHGHWTPLHSSADIWNHLSKADVLLRMFSQLLIIPYCLILFALPYNYHKSSASRRSVWIFSMALLGISLIHIVLSLIDFGALHAIFPLMVSLFYARTTVYELNERLRPIQETVTASSDIMSSDPANQDLWSRICLLMGEKAIWQDPDLNLITLSRLCATNITYLSRTIQQNTGRGFKELVNEKRVSSVKAQIEQDPDTDIQSAFFNAGYRSRTTAWRNFKEITGMSPAEYKLSLKTKERQK